MSTTITEKTAGDTFHGWWIEVTCPRCGGPLVHVADGAPRANEIRSICRCNDCGHKFVAQLVLVDASPELGRRAGNAQPPIDIGDRTHGNAGSYKAGCRCDRCLDGYSEHNRRRYEARQAS